MPQPGPLSGATILQVIPDLAAGGAERTTIEIAEALKAAGATALVASAGGRLESELARAGGELIAMPSIGSKHPAEIWANAGRLAGIVRDRNVAIIHARSRAPAWSALWAARRTGKPFVTTYHGVYRARSGLKRLYNSVMARGDVVIANSEYTAAHVRREHPNAASRIVVIPRGVDIARFSQDAVSETRREALSHDWGLDQGPVILGDAVTILLPGRLTAWKGQREAIRAAGILAARSDLPPWRMILAGDAQGRDAYEVELQELITNHGLDGRVLMVGHCSDMPAAFALSDIVIAPSREPEAFGRVAAEAGAMGRPVIGSNLGGQREVIVAGETGLLTAPGDPAPLAEAVVKLILAGPEARRAMGAAGEARVREKYTADALQRATLGVYDGLIGRAP